MKFLLLTIFFFGSTAWSGLPPTTTKGSADASFVTTFNFAFPNVTMTHSGSTATFGTVGVASGGTGRTTLTAKGVLIGNTTNGILSTAAGTSGQLLQSGGSTVAPDWTTATYPSTNSAAGRFIRGDGTNFAESSLQLPNTATSPSVLAANSSSNVSAVSGSTANRLLRTNGTTISFAQADLTTDVTGILPVANGGTGASSLTANNVILGNGTSAVQVVAPGTSGNVLTSNGTTWQSTALPATTAVTAGYDATNLTITTSVASNALTIALKTKAGTDPAAGDPVTVGFRNSTVGTGTYTTRTITSALSLTIPSGTALGSTNGQSTPYFVYLIDNAGTPELAVSMSGFQDQGALINTTAISGGNSSKIVYSGTARTGVPIRLIGRFTATEATAGTWATNASAITPLPFYKGEVTSSAYTPERMERIVFGDSSSTACATNPCSYQKQSGYWVDTVSRAGTGDYTLNITANTFSAAPSCVCGGSDVTSPTACSVYNSTNTATAVRVTTKTTAGAAQNELVTVICMGPR
jgi:hypothetical protein